MLLSVFAPSSVVVANDGGFKSGGSSGLGVCGPQTALPPGRCRTVQPAVFLRSLSAACESWGAGSDWTLIRSSSSSPSVPEFCKRFLSLFLSHSVFCGLRPREFPKGKNQRTAGWGPERRRERIGCSSARASLPPTPPLRPLRPEPPGSPPGEQTQLTSRLQSLFKTVSKVTNYRASRATGSSGVVSLQINCPV